MICCSTLGRLSKSTSRLTSAPTSNGLTTTSSGNTTVRRIDSLGGRGGVQTLPRKLRDDSASRTRRQVSDVSHCVSRCVSAASPSVSGEPRPGPASHFGDVGTERVGGLAYKNTKSE